MITKKSLVVSALTCVAAGTLVLTQTVGSNQQPPANKLEGGWIARVPGTKLQWGYVLSPSDPSGRRAALSGSTHVSIPVQRMIPGLFPDFDFLTPFTGEAVVTGPDTAQFTIIGYSMKKIPPSEPGPDAEAVAIVWVNSGEMKVIAPGKVQTTHHVSYYLPEADADGDGLPDPGAVPILCLPPTVSIDTRLGVISPCVP